jgi:hypothetical protein
VTIEATRPLLGGRPLRRPAPQPLTGPAITIWPGRAVPPPKVTRLDLALNRVAASQGLWLAPVLVLQAVLCFRLDGGMADDEALAINAGHQMIAHLLHGSPAPAFGRYFAGMPAFYSIPAAMLDRLGGAALVRDVNTLLVLAATVAVYLATRRVFGQGAALFAGVVFALNPATIYIARFASADAPCVLTLAVALHLAMKASRGGGYPAAAGALLATAVAAKYVAILFLPGALLVSYVVTAQRTRPRRAAVITSAVAASAAATLAVLAVVGQADGQGLAANALGGQVLQGMGRLTALHDGWAAVGPVAIIALLAVAVLPGRRALAVALCTAGIAPVVVQVATEQPAGIARNAALTMVFLAPVLGAAGVWLVSRGRWLALRAPLAFVALLALLSSGMATSAQMAEAWPATDGTIDGVLAHDVHEGSQRYLVDGSDLPAYQLSGMTHYDQWVSTLSQRYTAAGGMTRLYHDIQDGAYRLVLYRDNGVTPALDRSMVATLRTRYTLVARVPVSPGDPTNDWSLWLSELPR